MGTERDARIHPPPLHSAPPIPGVGEILGRTFQLYFSCLPTIAFIALLVFLPVEGVKSVLLHATGYQNDIRVLIRVDGLIFGTLSCLASAAVIRVASARLLNGQRVPSVAAVEWGISRWWRIFVNRFFSSFVVLIGCILLVIPGVVAWVWFYLTDAVVCLGGESRFLALDRSRALSRQCFWRILFTGAVLTFVVIAIQIPAALVLTILAPENWIADTCLDLIIDGLWMLIPVHLVVLYFGINGTRNTT